MLVSTASAALVATKSSANVGESSAIGRSGNARCGGHLLALFGSGDELGKGAVLDAIQVAEIVYDCASTGSWNGGRRECGSGVEVRC